MTTIIIIIIVTIIIIKLCQPVGHKPVCRSSKWTQCHGKVQWCPLASEHTLQNATCRNVKGSGKVIRDPHPKSHQHQNLTTSRQSCLGQTYRVWSTSITAFMSYLAQRWRDTQTDDVTTIPAPPTGTQVIQWRHHNRITADRSQSHTSKVTWPNI